MMMKNVLAGVILGLLTVVRTTPVNTVTQTPSKAEDEVLREAVTDGFLVDHFFPSTLSTKSPISNTGISGSRQLTSSDSEKVAIGEVSEKTTTQDGGDHETTTTQSDSHAQSSSTVLSKDTSSSVPHEAHSSVTPGNTLVSQSTDTTVHSLHFLSTLSSDSGSGDEEDTAPSSTVTSASSTSVAAKVQPRLFGETEGSGSGETTTAPSTSIRQPSTAPGAFSEPEEGSGVTVVLTTVKNQDPEAQEIKEHVTAASPQTSAGTPSWIIILGFIVGVAALVLLCVAIATREKWNGPNQVSQPENKSGSSNQQRELEMETFLHKEEPRENGKAAEYTVIPLDELPESSSSH